MVYEKAELDFYKYTAKLIPDNMYHAFKILGAHDSSIVNRFVDRNVAEVIERGMFYKGARIRKEFCLEGYSTFVHYFHQRKIYYPHAMETYVLLCFHQYLNQEKISWSSNKVTALKSNKKSNRIWRKRKRKLFRKGKVDVKESPKKDKKERDPLEYPDALFWEEFENQN